MQGKKLDLFDVYGSTQQPKELQATIDTNGLSAFKPRTHNEIKPP
jgi:hypothetical protein